MSSSRVFYGWWVAVAFSGLTDRFGARRVTPAGSVHLALSLALTAYCHTLWQLALVYGVLAAATRGA